MTFEEAIKILGLKTNFTETDLKSQYRKLAKEYHPDNFIDELQQREATEKMKKINEAYDILKKGKNKQNKAYYQNNKNTVDLEFCKEIINKITRMIIFDAKKLEKVPENIRVLFKEIIEYGKYTRTQIGLIKSKDKVNAEYNDFLKFRNDKLKNIKDIFYKNNYIEESDVTITLNFDSNLEVFYDTLEKINKQFGREEKFKKTVDDELFMYTSLPFYEKLKVIIDAEKERTIKRARSKKFLDTDEIIREMHTNIRSEIDGYYYVQSKVDELTSIVQEIDDEEIKNCLIKLQNAFQMGVSNIKCKELIKQLEDLIKQYQDNKEREQKVMALISKCYDLVYRKYIEVISKFEALTDLEKVSRATNIFNKLLECMKLIKDGKLDCKVLEEFTKISFLDEMELNSLQVIIDSVTVQEHNKKSDITRPRRGFQRDSNHLKSENKHYDYINNIIKENNFIDNNYKENGYDKIIKNRLYKF